MELPQIGETWTGIFENKYEHTFKIVGIMPVREYMETVADKLQREHTEGEEAKWAGVLREKINAGDYDKIVNMYLVHYTKYEYADGAYHSIPQTALLKFWENLRRLV